VGDDPVEAEGPEEVNRRGFLLGLMASSALVQPALALSSAQIVPYNGASIIGHNNLALSEIIRAIKILDDNAVDEPQFIVVPQWWIDMIEESSK
jgi:hypothetical protein